MKISRFLALAIALSFTALGAQSAFLTQPSFADGANVLKAADICEHQWSEWQVDEGPTCQEPGEESRYCLICSMEEFREIPSSGEHDWYEWQVDEEPTCSEPGLAYRYCSICWMQETRGLPATGEHDWGEWGVFEYPTCTKAGSKYRECYECGTEQEKSVPAKGHKWSGWKTTKKPTCTKAGYKQIACKTCGKVQKRKKLSAKGHDWSGWKVAKQATKLSKGKNYRQCANCEKRQTKAAPKVKMSSAEKGAYDSSRRFFNALKHYNVKRMKSVYVTDTKDFFASGHLHDTCVKRFEKIFSYKIASISSKDGEVALRVRVTHPYAYDAFYDTFSHWYQWFLRKYPDVEEGEASNKLIQDIKRNITSGSLRKESTTLSITLSKYDGVWKVVGNTKLKDVLDCGYDKATDDFKYNYYLD